MNFPKSLENVLTCEVCVYKDTHMRCVCTKTTVPTQPRFVGQLVVNLTHRFDTYIHTYKVSRVSTIHFVYFWVSMSVQHKREAPTYTQCTSTSKYIYTCTCRSVCMKIRSHHARSKAKSTVLLELQDPNVFVQ